MKTPIKLLFVASVTALAVAGLPVTASAQNIFVANFSSGKVAEFDPSGNLITNAFVWGLNGPAGLAFDSNGNLYVANYFGNVVSKFNASGILITNSFASGLNGPIGLAFDGGGNLYVANLGSSTV